MCTYIKIMFSSQNPKEADAMTKLQTDLDETKIILVGFLAFVFFLDKLLLSHMAVHSDIVVR